MVRNYLRFYGPARVADAAKFLDSPLSEVRDHWPEDAVAVEVSDLPGGREQRWALAGDLAALRDAEPASPASAGGVRLLGPYDAWVQLRDRETLVPTRTGRKDLWRTIGRPGAVAVGGELVGTWRPSSKGTRADRDGRTLGSPRPRACPTGSAEPGRAPGLRARPGAGRTRAAG